MIRTLSPTVARRMAIARQHLAGARLPSDSEGIMTLMRDLGCIQIDPISIVARSHQIVLWSRLERFDLSQLDKLLWQERRLFEYWAHCASVVPTEDYPIHNLLMRKYAADDTPWDKRVRRWIQDNDALRRHILAKIRREGPLPSRAIQDAGLDPKAWVSTGWTSGRNVSRMLDFLWMNGKIMVAGRSGLQKMWDLTERILPGWTPRERLNEREVVRRASQKSLRALGIATPRHIERHYIRGRYPNLSAVLAQLEKEGRIERVAIEGYPGTWYVHADDIALLDRIEHDWEPRTTLLSPFDNLICDRARTRILYDFNYSIEIYVPKAKRQHGYYVLPILHGDRLIGRIDPVMDRAHGELRINAVYAEPDAPKDKKTACAIRDVVMDLAQFLGAKKIIYSRRVPGAWTETLRRS